MNYTSIAAVLALSAFVAGCEAPTLPRPVPRPSPKPTTTVAGRVFDTALRPLTGVKLEVLDGPQAGVVTTSDAEGRFTHTGTYTGPLTFRASKEGYLDASREVFYSDGLAAVTIYLELLAPANPGNIAGDYTMTFVADDACTDLPSEVRTRTYPATITPALSGDVRANTYFNGKVSGASLLAERNFFFIGAAGDDLGFVFYNWEGEGASLVDQLDSKTYLAFYGRADVSSTRTGDNVNVAFDGSIDYCVATSGSYESCFLNQAATHRLCVSKNHRLLLTRR